MDNSFAVGSGHAIVLVIELRSLDLATNFSRMKTKPKETGKSVQETIEEINKKHGDATIMKLDQKPAVGVDSIPTGSFGLDIALGIGGFPRGRIVEIYGPEASGKTTLALHCVAEAQKLQEVCAYIDAEHAMDPLYASRLGVNTSELLISQPDSGEQAFEILESLIRSKKFGVVVIDSVAALTPQSEIEGEFGQQHMGRHARLMGQAMRKLVSMISASNTVVIFINQIRYNLNAMPGTSPETTPGGKALKFAASVRLDIRRIAQIKKGEEVMGGRVRVKVVKNKVAAPFKQTEFDLMYNEGISFEGEILAMGAVTGVLGHSGVAYSFGETKLGRGYDASRQFLKENVSIAQAIKLEIKAKL